MKRFLWLLLLVVTVVGAFIGYELGFQNVISSDQKELYISRDLHKDDLYEVLQDELNLPSFFPEVADRMNLKNHFYSGKYTFESPTSMIQVIRKIRSGQREEIDVVLRSHLHRPQLLGTVSNYLEVDSLELENYLLQSDYLQEWGFNKETWPSMFIANTYKMNWAANAEEVFERFYHAYSEYWNEERKSKALQLDLTPIQCTILASIVEGETNKRDEMGRIAGVYLNRLAEKWPLQSDPTVMYIIRYENRTRVLKKDTELEHPYNTYRNLGLPPGPIIQPSIDAIEAVLNPEVHSYMFFCAKPDFSGYHVFAQGLSEHNRNAAAYHRALNRAGIRR
jgi:UPF0755 protein